MEVNFNVDLIDITSASGIKNSSKAVSINEAGIDSLAVDTMQVSMAINDYLNKIIDIMNGSKEYFNCPEGDVLRKKFAELSETFPIVVQNIENYAYSLKKAKSNMIDRREDAIAQVHRATENVQDLIKEQ